VEALQAYNEHARSGLPGYALVNAYPNGATFGDKSKIVDLQDGRFKIVSPTHGYDYTFDTLSDTLTDSAGTPLPPGTIVDEQAYATRNVGADKIQAVGKTTEELMSPIRLLQRYMAAQDMPPGPDRDRAVSDALQNLQGTPAAGGIQYRGGKTVPIDYAPEPTPGQPNVDPYGQQFGREEGPAAPATPARHLVESQAWNDMVGQRANAHMLVGSDIVGEGKANSTHTVPYDDGSEVTYRLGEPYNNEETGTSGYKVLGWKVHVPHLVGQPGEAHTYEREHVHRNQRQPFIKGLKHKLTITGEDGQDYSSDVDSHDIGEGTEAPQVSARYEESQSRARARGMLEYNDEAYAADVKRQEAEAPVNELFDKARDYGGLPEAMTALPVHRLRQHGVQMGEGTYEAGGLAKLTGDVVGRNEMKTGAEKLAELVSQHQDFHPNNFNEGGGWSVDPDRMDQEPYLNYHWQKIMGSLRRITNPEHSDKYDPDTVASANDALRKITAEGGQEHQRTTGRSWLARIQNSARRNASPEIEEPMKERATPGRKPTEPFPHETPITVHGGTLRVQHSEGGKRVSKPFDITESHPEILGATTIGELHEALKSTRVVNPALVMKEAAGARPEERSRGGVAPHSALIEATVHTPEGPKTLHLSGNPNTTQYRPDKGEASRAKKNRGQVAFGVYHPMTNTVLHDPKTKEPHVFISRQAALDAAAQNQASGAHEQHVVIPLHHPQAANPRRGLPIITPRPPDSLARENLPRETMAREEGKSYAPESAWGGELHTGGIAAFHAQKKAAAEVTAEGAAREAPIQMAQHERTPMGRRGQSFQRV
jgi:hypothetical protein